jgi:hypothetical protein
MGSAAAYYPMQAPPGLRSAMIEMDPSYSLAFTPLSMSNARIQSGLRSNVHKNKTLILYKI